MKYKFQLIVLMAISLFVAGCITSTGGINAQALIEANDQVQTLLEQYPNANLDVTYYSVNESSQLEEEYNSICSKEFTQKALYRFSLQDETQGLNVVGYLNPTEQAVECVSREGRENNTNSNTQNNESSTSSNDTSTIVNSTTEEVSLYFDVEAEYEGIEPTQEQRELLEELRELTNNFNSTFKLEFEIEVDEGEVSSQEEGIVGSQEILDTWSELLSQITTQVENSTAQEIEVSVEVAKKRVEEGDDGGNSFEIKVESGDSNREDEEIDVDIELTINEEEESTRAEIEINDREEVMEFNTTSLEEIKQRIASEYDLEYGIVVSNTKIEYEYSDDKEEKEDSVEENNEEIEESQFSVEQINIQNIDGTYLLNLEMKNNDLSSGVFTDAFFEVDGVESRESVTVDTARSTQTFELSEVLTNFDDLTSGKVYELKVYVEDSSKTKFFVLSTPAEESGLPVSIDSVKVNGAQLNDFSSLSVENRSAVNISILYSGLRSESGLRFEADIQGYEQALLSDSTDLLSDSTDLFSSQGGVTKTQNLQINLPNDMDDQKEYVLRVYGSNNLSELEYKEYSLKIE